MRKFSYDDARTSSHGSMRCSVCNAQITEGRYRYYSKSKAHDWGYVSQHEACTSDDPEWAEMDRRIVEAARKRRELSAACVEFKAKWGVGELDEYIIEAAAAGATP